MAAAPPPPEPALPVPGPPAATSRAVSACGGARPCSRAASLSSDIRASCSRPPLGERALRVRLRLGLLLLAAGLRRRRGLLCLDERIFLPRPAGGLVHRVGKDELHLPLRLIGDGHQGFLVALGQGDAPDAG